MAVGRVASRTKCAAPTPMSLSSRGQVESIGTMFSTQIKRNLEGLRPQRTLVNGVGKVPFAEYRVSPQINRLCSTWPTPDESVPGITDSPWKLTTFFETEFPDNEVSPILPRPGALPPPVALAPFPSPIDSPEATFLRPPPRPVTFPSWPASLPSTFLSSQSYSLPRWILDKPGILDKQRGGGRG